MKREVVDIACDIRLDDPTKDAIAVWDGTEEADPYRKGQKREKWCWLPRQHVEINGDGTVTIPVWLAEKKGLV